MDSTRVPPARQDAPSTNRYTRLPDALLYVLTPREHQLLHLLLSYRWTPDAPIYPFVGTMAEQLGWSVRTVQRTLRSLEAGGYIVAEARYRDSDKGQTSSVYHPGPMLVPYLSLVDGVADRGAEQPRHPPVTAASGRKKHRNDTTRNYLPQPGYISPVGGIDYLGGPLAAYIRT